VEEDDDVSVAGGVEPVGVEGEEGGRRELGFANVFGRLPTATPAGAWSRVLILSLIQLLQEMRL
jgi:hypothetical protein